jgi:hypothetical protein
MENISPENVSGFVVGEGCFYVEFGGDKKYKLGYRVRPAFCIEVRYDDKDVLEAVREHLGCGNIYDLDFGRYKGYERKKWKPHVKYRVSNFEDISRKVVPFFKRYSLFGKKKRSFDLFCEVVGLMEQKAHLSQEGLQRISLIVNELRSLNKKGI